MRVLVTGSRGLIGAAVAATLAEARHVALGYDLKEGRDILGVPTLREAMRGCDAVIHAAALLGLPQESPSQIMEVNLQGTWNVLSARNLSTILRHSDHEFTVRPRAAATYA
jgi:nucleoside-diphosphate-sugar epimerase